MSETLQNLRSQIPECYLGDQFTFGRKLRHIELRAQQNKPYDKGLTELANSIEASVNRVEARREKLPTIEYADLPVSERVSDIKKALSEHQVVIIAGETGSGKTTQIPKICLELGQGVKGLIGHTQPRRLAARAVASRIAEELHTFVGQGVGYQVRFHDQVAPTTHIKLMTDGILLAEIQRDRYLSQYDTIIIDEAHERSLNIDFLLGYLKQLLPRRKDLKLVVTSATIDVERFSKHFENAPVIEVSGRSFPVEIRYRPMEEMEEGNDVPSAIENTLYELKREGANRKGDVLVFLPGEREIREAAKHLRHSDLPNTEVLPLYARLSNAEQNRIFDLKSRRGWRIILTTNVAETSLTVPGIHFVIDAGTARISRYSYRSKVQRLPVEPVSQASANQRSGRCGRVAPGVAVRLYSEDDFVARPEFTEPEILRTNLAAVILQMLQLGLGDVEAFPFLEPPDSRLINDGYRLLEELGAVAGRKMTGLGKKLSQFPVDPRIARMLHAAANANCLRELLIIASALSIQDPRDRPQEKRQASDEKHRRFWHEHSDFLAYVSLWDYYEEQRQELSQNQLRKLCQKDFLGYMRMREWRDVHHQLSIVCKQQKLDINKEPANYNAVHQSLLSGLLGNIGQLHEKHEYLGARNRKLKIFPGSSQFKKKPKWMMASELVETTELYARCVAKIEPEWALQINPSLLKRSYSEPHWQARTGQVMAYESTRLYGLPLRERHRIHYGPIDPKISREILIREGLVEGNYRGKASFYAVNKGLIKKVQALEEKGRRRDVLISEEQRFDFYDAQIPEGIYTAGKLDHWFKTLSKADAKPLYFTEAMLISSDATVATGSQFPDQIQWEGVGYPLKYFFQPGHTADGVTVEIPVAVLNRAPEHRFEWLVPGLLEEKCIALVKALPKALRKQLVPVPDHVQRVLPTLKADNSSLALALGNALKQSSGISIPPEAWSTVGLEDFYRMNHRITGERSKSGKTQVLGEGRDLPALKAEFADAMSASLEQHSEQEFASGEFKRWDFGDLPKEHKFSQGGVELRAYPAIVAGDKHVTVELKDTEQEANRASLDGVISLYRLRLAEPVKHIQSALLKGNEVQLQFAAIKADRKSYLEQTAKAVLAECFGLREALPRNEADFEATLTANKHRLQEVAETYEQVLKRILKSRTKIAKQLKKHNDLTWYQNVADIQQQLDHLFEGDFIVLQSLSRLEQFPRYLEAIENRLDKLRGNDQKDRQMTRLLEGFYQSLWERWSDTPSPAMLEFRWLLEEFRVSLFDQRLGTAEPVSEKRLKALWREILAADAPKV